MSLNNRLLAKFGVDARELYPFAAEGLVTVNEKRDLPAPVDGVITLEAGKTYHYTMPVRFITFKDIGQVIPQQIKPPHAIGRAVCGRQIPR